MPICTPLAPSANAAAMPRASATPPAAMTGTSTASTTCGTSANVPSCVATSAMSVARNMPRWPPASAPWAITTSHPWSASQRASSTVVALDSTRGAGGLHPIEEPSVRQSEVEADDRRAQFLDQLAPGGVERRDDRRRGRRCRRRGRARRSTGRARVATRRPRRRPPSGAGRAWQKKLRFTGRDVAARIAASSLRISSTSSSAHGQRAEPTGLADGDGQRRSLGAGHRGLDDRHVEAQQVEQPGVRPVGSSHAPSVAPASRATTRRRDQPVTQTAARLAIAVVRRGSRTACSSRPFVQ